MRGFRGIYIYELQALSLYKISSSYRLRADPQTTYFIPKTLYQKLYTKKLSQLLSNAIVLSNSKHAPRL